MMATGVIARFFSAAAALALFFLACAGGASAAENDSWRWEAKLSWPGANAKMLKFVKEGEPFTLFEPLGKDAARGMEPSAVNPGVLISVSNMEDGKVVVEVWAAGRFGSQRTLIDWREMFDLMISENTRKKIEIPVCPTASSAGSADYDGCLSLDIEARKMGSAERADSRQKR